MNWHQQKINEYQREVNKYKEQIERFQAIVEKCKVISPQVLRKCDEAQAAVQELVEMLFIEGEYRMISEGGPLTVCSDELNKVLDKIRTDFKGLPGIDVNQEESKE